MEGARSAHYLSGEIETVRCRRRRHRGYRCRREAPRRRGDGELQGGAAAVARSPDRRRLCRRRVCMAELTYRDAVARGIAQEMVRDPDVIFFGEAVGKPG